MTISCLGAGTFLCIFATYSFLNDNNEIPNHLNWIPILCLSATVFLQSIGISSLLYIMITELVPPKVNKIKEFKCLIIFQFQIRENSLTIFMTLVTAFGFVNLKIFPILIESIQLYGALWIYSGCCICGTFISLFVLPETKGKNLFQK
jgi:hypothetical protein